MGAQRKVRLGDLTHRDGRLHTGVDAALFQEVLKSQTVHHRPEHAHVVRSCTVEATLLQFGSAEEITAADDDRHLHSRDHHLGDLVCDSAQDIGVEADLTAPEHLATELEQYAVVALTCGLGGIGGFAHQHPHSSVRLVHLMGRPPSS